MFQLSTTALVENRSAGKLRLCNHSIRELNVISRIHLLHSLCVSDEEAGHIREMDSIADLVEKYLLIERSADCNSVSEVAYKRAT